MKDHWHTLVRNALVFDGTGAPPRREDVAIANGRVAARGPADDLRDRDLLAETYLG